MSKPMDFSTLSRRELQALCKSYGIPANKTNVFMIDALEKKRVPVPHVDANRNEGLDDSIGNPFKSPPLARKNNTNANGIGPARKPPLFANNFLRRGKRNDAPTWHDIDPEETPRVQSTNASAQKSSIDLSQRPSAGAAPAKTEKAEGVSQSLRQDQMVSTRAKVDSALKSATLCGSFEEAKVEKHSGADRAMSSSSNDVKGQIEDRIRSQINAALRSKVMKAPERQPSAGTCMGSSQRVLESNLQVHNSEALNSPLENPQQQKEEVLGKVESSEVFDIPPEHPEQQMESLSFPDSPACIITKREENISSPTPAVQRPASLDLIEAYPLLRFSPFIRQVDEIVDRIHNFWKSRDLAVVNGFGSPVQ